MRRRNVAVHVSNLKYPGLNITFGVVNIFLLTVYEVNAADGRRGARIIRPARNSEIPLNKNHYRHGDRCVSHKIGKGEILIDLGQIYLVDTFKIFLEDFETE